MRDPIILPESSEPTRPVHVKRANDNPKPTRQEKTAGKDNFWLPKRSHKTERLEALTKARLRYPENTQLKVEIYQEVKEVLDQDPFLAYEAENEAAYKFHNHADEILIIPKERAVPESFPPPRPETIRKAYRYLLWALLGLVLSGLGALILAPAAGLLAARASAGEARREDRARARVILGLSVFVFAIGLALAYLFWLHWVG